MVTGAGARAVAAALKASKEHQHDWIFSTEIQSNIGTFSRWVCECGAVKEVKEFTFQEKSA